MTRILLIRHGQSVANLQSRFAGHSDYPLTEIGIRQAKLAAEYITSHYKIDRIYSSDLLRAFQTAEQTAKLTGLEIIPDERLREVYAGEWETLTFDEIIKDYPQDFDIWMNDFGKACCPGGESIIHMSGRICAAIDDIAGKNKGKCVLIATHATPIRAFECRCRGLDAGEMGKIKFVDNAALSEYVWTAPGVAESINLNITEYMKGITTSLPETIISRTSE